MAGALDSYTKFEMLRRATNLTPAPFSALCGLYEIQGVSDASLNRAIQKQKFTLDVEPHVRPLLLRLEDLVERAQPFPISFENVEHVRNLLDAIAEGIDARVEFMPLYAPETR